MKNILAVLGIALLSGCSGDDSSEPNTPFIKSKTSDISITTEARIIYPQLDIDELDDFCDSSESENLVGCYVSETCQSNGVDAARLFVTSFTTDGQLRSKILLFIDQATCSDEYLEVGLSAFDLVYQTGNNLISSSGVEVRAIDSEHHFDAGSLGTLITEYVSSFHLENNRLCFPAQDYAWGTSGGGLAFSVESDSDRPTNINFDECMIRLND